MAKKLFVGGISWNTGDAELRQAFESFGEVLEATVVTDRQTGRSRGFGSVSFSDDESAAKAMSELDGRNIRVNEAHDRPST
jgi:RNA recognition motif-containing protein